MGWDQAARWHVGEQNETALHPEHREREGVGGLSAMVEVSSRLMTDSGS